MSRSSSLRVATAFVALLLTIAFDGAESSSAVAYPNGLPADPNFFPIGVWLQSPQNAPEFRALGVNTFVGLWQGPTEAQLSALAKSGMFAIAEQNETALRSPNAKIIKAWLQGDEPDNAQPSALLGFGPCIPASGVARQSGTLKARDPTRPVMINFGQGVAYTGWIGRGSCTGDEKYYDTAIKGVDILSFDIYPVASNIPAVQGKLEYVARGVDALARRATKEQSVWSVIETTSIQSRRRATGAEVRAELWMSLIHGAKGIVYFVHEWTDGFREDGIFRHEDVVEEVRRDNRLIQTLAPVLNSDNRPGLVAISSPSISAMVKEYGNALYVFAVAMDNKKSTVRFQTRVPNGTAEVLEENRSLAMTNGSFEDSFAGYGVHLYRIPLPGRR